VLSTVKHPPQTNSTSPVQFFHLLERLKTTKREGWRRFGIDRGESIADHMYRMSILTMLAPPSLSSRLNVPHCTKMALLHDMAESLVGDITPVDGVLKTEKNRRETETMDYLCKGLLGNVNGGLSGEDIKRVWQEYEDSETLEAKFVHDVDKMELLLQMVEYERTYEGRIDLGELTRVVKRIVLPELKAWSSEILRERQEFWKTVGKVPNGGDASAEEMAMFEEYYGKENGST
jgi:putative hydrolases of HD superfamily